MLFRIPVRKITKLLQTVRCSGQSVFYFPIPYSMIPERTTLMQLNSILKSIRPTNLSDLRDSFRANYETLINMAAFYGTLFVKKLLAFVVGGLR